MRSRSIVLAALCAAWAAPISAAGSPAAGSPAAGSPAAPPYNPIVPSLSDRTVTLTGRDLSIDDIVAVARGGAKVVLSEVARGRQAANYGLLLEAAAEGVPVYWFNRGSGDQRETVMFNGDPLSPKNRALIEKTQAERFRSGARWGT